MFAHAGADPVLADAADRSRLLVAAPGPRRAPLRISPLTPSGNWISERTWAMLDHARGSVLLADGELD